MNQNHSFSMTPSMIRRLAIHKQRLMERPIKPSLKTVRETIQALGCVQIDPLRAVERTQLLVLWSRLGNFDPTWLDKLMWEERSLFEYWGHEASIVCTSNFALHSRQMAAFRKGRTPAHQRSNQWLKANGVFRKYILRILRERGSCHISELENRAKVPWERGGWNDNQTVSMMIYFLWTHGDITVVQRRGLNKRWGLVKDHFPKAVLQERLSDTEAERRATLISLRALGAARPEHIKKHFTRNYYPNLTRTLQKLLRQSEIVRVHIRDANPKWKGDWYIHRNDIEIAEAVAEHFDTNTRLLSPFDNLICDRQRTELLWDFEFRIEIYVPQRLRKYGYYVLPILHGEQLVGRIDPRMDRKTSTLIINAVYSESPWTQSTDVGPGLMRTLKDLGQFLDARQIKFSDGRRIPQAWRPALKN